MALVLALVAPGFAASQSAPPPAIKVTFDAVLRRMRTLGFARTSALLDSGIEVQAVFFNSPPEPAQAQQPAALTPVDRLAVRAFYRCLEDHLRADAYAKSLRQVQDFLQKTRLRESAREGAPSDTSRVELLILQRTSDIAESRFADAACRRRLASALFDSAPQEITLDPPPDAPAAHGVQVEFAARQSASFDQISEAARKSAFQMWIRFTGGQAPVTEATAGDDTALTADLAAIAARVRWLRCRSEFEIIVPGGGS